jgi:hypothetical protein
MAGRPGVGNHENLDWTGFGMGRGPWPTQPMPGRVLLSYTHCCWAPRVLMASSDLLASQVDEVQYGLDEGPCLASLRSGQVVQIDDLAGPPRRRADRDRNHRRPAPAATIYPTWLTPADAGDLTAWLPVELIGRTGRMCQATRPWPTRICPAAVSRAPGSPARGGEPGRAEEGTTVRVPRSADGADPRPAQSLAAKSAVG